MINNKKLLIITFAKGKKIREKVNTWTVVYMSQRFCINYDYINSLLVDINLSVLIATKCSGISLDLLYRKLFYLSHISL